MTTYDHKEGRPLAVALRYTGEGAPKVTASGKGEVAEQILALAREHDIPLHEDAGLVSVLAQIPLGEEIPERLYVAVAEVLAFAYLLSGKMPPRRNKNASREDRDGA